MVTEDLMNLEMRLYNLLFKPLPHGGVSSTLTIEITGSERDLIATVLRALERLEEANDKLASLRTQDMYLAMLDAGQEFALADLQDARRQAVQFLQSASLTDEQGETK